MVSHLSDILIYTLFGFSVLYPVYFWFVPRSKIDSGFYNFNLGLSGLIGGMAVVLAWATGTDQPFLFGMAGWLSIHLLITFINWNKEIVSFPTVLLPVISGGFVFVMIGMNMFPDKNVVSTALIGLLSHGILSGVMFAMILGHWYLNVIQLPISLLQKTTNALAVLLGVRLIWNGIKLPAITMTDTYGTTFSAFQYMGTLDGFFLGVAFFFGLCVPLALHFFIYRTLKLQATQSATGLLYISVLSILVGDLCYKFVLFQDGLLL